MSIFSKIVTAVSLAGALTACDGKQSHFGVDQTRDKVIMTMNTLIAEKSLHLPPNGSCVITVFFGEKVTRVILGCDEKLIFKDGFPGTGYPTSQFTQVTSVPVTTTGELDTNRGCLAVEYDATHKEGLLLPDGPDCEENNLPEPPPIDLLKLLPPNRKIM